MARGRAERGGEPVPFGGGDPRATSTTRTRAESPRTSRTTRFAFRSSDPQGEYAHTYTLTPNGDGTDVTHRVEFVKMRGLAAVLLPPVFALSGKPQGRKRMEVLKHKSRGLGVVARPNGGERSAHEMRTLERFSSASPSERTPAPTEPTPKGAPVTGIEIRRFEQADETRTFEHGSFELVTIGGVTIGRASYEPGWVWSEHVGKPAGERAVPGRARRARRVGSRRR